MSIEKITSKIISDAEAVAKVTLDEAQARCDEILAEAVSRAEAIKNEAEKTNNIMEISRIVISPFRIIHNSNPTSAKPRSAINIAFLSYILICYPFCSFSYKFNEANSNGGYNTDE